MYNPDSDWRTVMAMPLMLPVLQAIAGSAAGAAHGGTVESAAHGFVLEGEAARDDMDKGRRFRVVVKFARARVWQSTTGDPPARR